MKAAAIQNISAYSLLESPTKVKDLVQVAQKKGYDAVGLCDINVTYGLVDFYQEAMRAGIKPLLGMTMRINGLVDQANKYDLLVFARDNEGYHNLLRLSSAINLLTDNGEADKSLSLTDLQKYLHHFNIIVPANQSSELLYLSQFAPDQGALFLRKLIANQDCNWYLGAYPAAGQAHYLAYVNSLAKQFSLPLVLVNDCQYLTSRDQFLRKTLLAIKNGKQLNDILQLMQQKGSHYLPAADEFLVQSKHFKLEAAWNNTNRFAADCNSEIVFQTPRLPKYQQKQYASSQDYLQQLTTAGLAARFKGQVPENYHKRLAYELRIIHEMGFDDYFLIVWDVVNHCRQEGITIGPGRGSACGSLVAYSLKITEIDPLHYNLLFERFLNPARHEMPDIDLDIPDNKRNAVITYMFKKYGMDHAAQILTFGTLAAKQALRDCCRVFGYSQAGAKKWTHAIPFVKGKISLDQAWKESRDLQLLTQMSPENKLLFQTARAIENIPRHYSIHAAGLVISDQSIAAISGLQAGPLGIPVTQQTKKYVEPLGLLKIDFLGLRNLTILGQTLALIKSQGQKLDPNRIPLDDPATLRLFQKGETDAVFQFESGGIRNVLRRLHPDNFEDLVAVNALYRPGPMQNISHFIARKQGKEQISYPDPILQKILRPTYGILVYQEQVMQTAQLLAGFSLGEADILRRAMSKKNQAVIEKEKDKFIKGCLENGHKQQVAENVYHYIEQFANYGFNRSHAVAYTEIAFWLAYLKVHYPAAFYTSMLNSTLANKTKLQSYVLQLNRSGKKILPPDINDSKIEFSLKKGQILTGLKAIKGLRVDFAREIAGLHVKSFEGFLHQIDPKYLQPAAIENLIKAGCFDHLESNRNLLLQNCKEVIENVKLTGNNLVLSKTLGGTPMKAAPAPSTSEKAAMEEEAMGFAATTTPLIAVQRYAKRFHARSLADFAVNQEGISVGKLMKLKKLRTKKGKTMAFATFADFNSNQEFVIFPGVYKKVQHLLKSGEIYLLGLRVQSDRFDPNKKQYLLTNLRLVNFKEEKQN